MATGDLAAFTLPGAVVVAIVAAIFLAIRGVPATRPAIGATALAVGINALLAALTDDLVNRQAYFAITALAGCLCALIVGVTAAIVATRARKGDPRR